MFRDPALQWEHCRFTLNKEPFDFKEATVIRLNMSLGSCLKWEKELALAKKAKYVLFHLDFGFGESFPSMDDMTPFLSLGLAMDAFSALCKEIGERAVGAILLKGNEYFSPLAAWDGELIDDMKSLFMKLGRPIFEHLSDVVEPVDRLILEVFARDRVMGYVSLLASQLPEGIAGLIDVTGKGLSPFQTAYLFSPSAFGGVSLMGVELPAPPAVGILLPELSFKFIELMPRFEHALRRLKVLGIPCRSINAEQFHEQWDLLEVAIGLPGLMSESALCQCVGFCAAGGEFVSLGSEIAGIDLKTFEMFVTESAQNLITKATLLRDPNRQMS